MTHHLGEITSDHSAKGLIAEITKLPLSSSGNFVDYEGDILPW